MKNIATHNGKFHADDVLAIALVKIFIDKEIITTRVKHATLDFDNYDLIIDVGLKHDGVRYFDHHQDKKLSSACKLLWKSINLNYPTVNKLVSLVSDFDTGISMCSKFEFPKLIESLNTDNIYDDLTQLDAFNNAVDFTCSLINNYVKYDLEQEETEKIIKTTQVIDGVIRLPKYCKG